MRQPPVYSPISLGAIAGAWLAAQTRGPRELDELTRLHRDRFYADEVRLTSSGTHALQLGLALLPGLVRGERVVAMPAYSCYDLVTAAVGSGVRVRFYDVDPATLSPDLDSLRTAVAAGVSGVVASNLYGHPVDWTSLRSIANEAGVPVIEDAAQGLGSSTELGASGGLGDLTILSFGRGKGWTGGGGGALLGRGRWGPVGAQLVRSMQEAPPNLKGRNATMRSALVTTAVWGLGRPRLYGLPTSIPGLDLGETVYAEPTSPRRMAGFNAALARRTASASLHAVEARRTLASALARGIGDTRSVRAINPIGGAAHASFLRLPVLAVDRESASRLHREGRRLGIESGYPEPLSRLRAARPITLPSSASLFGSIELSTRLLTLPTHHWIGEDEQRQLARALGSAS